MSCLRFTLRSFERLSADQHSRFTHFLYRCGVNPLRASHFIAPNFEDTVGRERSLPSKDYADPGSRSRGKTAAALQGLGPAPPPACHSSCRLDSSVTCGALRKDSGWERWRADARLRVITTASIRGNDGLAGAVKKNSRGPTSPANRARSFCDLEQDLREINADD